MPNQSIIFRISPEHRAKLHQLMKRTHRGQTAILEMLLEQATMNERPDIELAGAIPAGDPDAAA